MRRSSANAADTSDAVAEMMMAKFERMTIAERAKLADELNKMCTKLAIAGIRARHGELDDDDLRWHLCSRRYGDALASEVYGRRSNP